MITQIAILLGGDAHALRIARRLARLYRAAKHDVAPEVETMLRDLESLQGIPLYEITLCALQAVLDIALSKSGEAPDRSPQRAGRCAQ